MLPLVRHAIATMAALGMALSASQTTASEIAPHLSDLAIAMPDGRDISSWYKKARTVSDVKFANAQLAGEVAKAGSVESGLGKLQAELTKSCKAASRSDVSQIQTIVIKMRSLQNALLDVQSELKKSVEIMRQNASSEKPGVAGFKLRHELSVYEAAFGQFAALQVNAQEIDKAVNALAATIQKTADGCGAVNIPPLFAERVPASTGGAPPARSSSLPLRRATKPMNAPTPRVGW
jgi:hypothetical protein